jgi:hypothetical protein
MFTLSIPVNKEEYNQHRGQQVLLGDKVVTVETDYVSGRSGSYERGFKFTSTTYGILRRDIQKKSRYKNGAPYTVQEYSADHGVTWASSVKDAKKAKGKIIVNRTSNGEFAFDKIQQLNREYYGPNYKWKP